MREIKFRYVFKNKDGEVVICVLTLQQIQDGWARETIDSKAVSGFELISVSQFTGLLDKNVKEIYEGDIIKVTGEFAIDDYGIVKWSQQEDDYTYHCGFMVDWQEEVKRRSHLSFWANHREIEIIGNIYENPELKENKNERD